MVFQKSYKTKKKTCQIQDIWNPTQNCTDVAANLYDITWHGELKRGTLTQLKKKGGPQPV